MLDREHLSDGPAGGVADEVRGLDAQRVHQLDDVAGHLLDGVRDARVGALAGAPVIVDDGPEVAPEVRDLGSPERSLPGEAGHQQQRLAPTGLFVVDLGVADRDLWHGG